MSTQSLTTSTQAKQTITALFDSRSEAKTAVDELVAAGIPRNSIRITPETDTVATSGKSYDTTRDEKGFWASLGDLFVPDDDRATYAEAMHRGSVMVAVTADHSHAQTAESILEEHGTVDLDEREAAWKSEGWSAAAPSLAASTSTLGLAKSTAKTTSTSSASARSGAPAGADDGSIKLYEEKLNIGKRQVSAGRVKIRSYVVETPVTEDVTLHSETVQLDRRPVDRAVEVGDAAFQDRTIEATEMAEEAVVSKTARVTEEIGLRKVAADQVKTISDKVRRTEVEIEDERKTGLAKPPLGAPRT